MNYALSMGMHVNMTTLVSSYKSSNELLFCNFLLSKNEYYKMASFNCTISRI